MLTHHPAWRALDADPVQRSIIWRGLLYEALTEHQLDEIRQYLQQQRAWGRDDFRATVEAKTQALCRHQTRPPTIHAGQVNLAP